MSQLLLSGGGNMMQRVALLECIPLALERYWSNAKINHGKSSATSTSASCWNEERAMFAIDAAAGAVLLGGAENVLVPASLVAFVEGHRQKTFHSQVLASSSSFQQSTLQKNCCSNTSSEAEPLTIEEAKNSSSNSNSAKLNQPREEHQREQLQQEQCEEQSEQSESIMEREIKMSMGEWDILRNEQCLIVLLDIHQNSNSSKELYNNRYGNSDSCPKEHTYETSHTAFWEFVSQYKEMYTKFCIPVPASPIASKLLFNNIPLDTFDAHYLTKFKEEIAQAGSCFSWQAWMRSALSCCYEGNYLPPIRLAEQTAKLLANSYNVHLSHQSNTRSNNKDDDKELLCGCSGVIWESAVGNSLTPRWLETSVKTAASCGVPVHALTLALADKSNTSSSANNNHEVIVPLLYKGLEMGITRYATCTLPDICTFDKTQTLPALDTVTRLIDGYNAFHATNNYYQLGKDNKKSVAGDNVRTALGNSWEYAEAVSAT